MNLHKITVIIPFYGVEDYIGRCIKSVKNQSFTNFECILIDDDSKDNSFEIVSSIIKDDLRFKIIRQENRGVGGARNKGLLNASGDYICFLDSDDWWEEDFLYKMMKEIQDSSCDIIVCNYREIYKDFTKKDIIKYKANRILNRIESSEEVLESPTVWNKIFKRSLWDGIFFPENIKSAEDLATLYKSVYNADKSCYIKDVLYNYYIREDSLTRVYSNRKLEDRLLAFNMIEKDVKDNFKKIKKNILNKLYYQHVVLPTYFDIISSRLSVIKKREQLQDFKMKLSKKYFNISSILFNNFIENKYKIMLVDFFIGKNILLTVQQIKRKYDFK